MGDLIIGTEGACADCIMSRQSDLLKERTMQFALDVLRLIDTFPRTIAGDVIGHQLAKAATSTAANYRATCNARSRAEFIAKLGLVVEESDESEFWLDVSIRKPMVKREAGEPLRREANELRAIFGRSLGTARANAAAAKRDPKSLPTRRPSPINQMTR